MADTRTERRGPVSPCTRSELRKPSKQRTITRWPAIHGMRTTSRSGGQHDHLAPEETTVNHSTRVMRRPRRAWPTAARTAAAIIATAALALLSAACDGSPSSTGSGSSSNSGGSANSKALAYAHCMRSDGVPDFPDPNSAGEFNKATIGQLSASNSQYQTATQACVRLLPNSGGGPTAAEG